MLWSVAARDLNVWGCCSVRHFRIRKIQAYCRFVSLLLFSIVHPITKTEANFNKFIKLVFFLGFRKHIKQLASHNGEKYSTGTTQIFQKSIA